MTSWRSFNNMFWSLVVLAGIAVGAYYVLPMIGGCMDKSMNSRDTMDRPSSMDLKPSLPSK